MLCRQFFSALWSKRRQSTGHTWIKSRQVKVHAFCAGPSTWNGWRIYLPSPGSQDRREFFVNLVIQRIFGTAISSASAPRRCQELTLDQLRQSLHSARWSTAAACLHTALATKSMFAAQPVVMLVAQRLLPMHFARTHPGRGGGTHQQADFGF